MEKYRFDDTCQSVYEYIPAQRAYVFMCKYLAADIETGMSDEHKYWLADNYSRRFLDADLDEQDAWDMAQ